ncbi:MAG TPA: DUF4397 domain-containing protein [Chitinophaga sp.]|uniref:DUF4397 domain-containing protein n=1 Tax=Chitinophaga sp. TaxID=1869181 RepID=UPI002DBD6329|nr:DUF4397 domain-containing protein [Chitinophaga sp.]HEU4555384.1 DUF4397 domain-containing protein [Chitinophaga sp.]
MRTKKYRLWAIAALVVTVTGFASCLKSDDTTPQRPPAYFWFIGAYTGHINMDLYDNGAKLNSSALTYDFTAPYQADGGIHIFTFKKNGSDSTLAEDTNLYDSLQSYTLILHGDSITGAEVAAIHDDYSSTSTSKVNYRFYNLSTSAGPVDMYINDSKLSGNVYYAGQAGFPGVFNTTDATGSGNVSIKIKAAGKDSLIAQKDNVPLNVGYPYTIYLKGDKNGADDRKLAVGIILHN